MAIDNNYDLRNSGLLYLWSNDANRPIDFLTLPKDANVNRVAVPYWYYHRHGGQDSSGWLSIALQGQKGEDIVDRIKNSAKRIESKFLEIGTGKYNAVFAQFIPSCTRSFGHALEDTFFPWTSHEKRGIFVIITLVVDLATLAFRLIALVPRALYQRYRSHPSHEGIEVMAATHPFDLRIGDIDIGSFTDPVNGLYYPTEVRLG